MPEADLHDPTDPYVRFELLQTDDVHFTTIIAASACTSVATINTTNPVWQDDDEEEEVVGLELVAGSAAAVGLLNGAWPVLRVSVLDYDEGDEDDLLGEAEVRLESKDGYMRRLVLRGASGFPDCHLSFRLRHRADSRRRPRPSRSRI